jgi:hypothetical protein
MSSGDKMGSHKRSCSTAGLVAVIAAVAIVPTAAHGAQIIGPQDPNDPQVDSPWQAGTCKADTPQECSIETPDQFFEEAAGHPKVGFTQFIVNTEPGGTIPPEEIPVANLRTVRVDLPAGLTVNPQSTLTQCELEPDDSPDTCAGTAPDSKVGTSVVTAVSTVFPTDGTQLTIGPFNVYNLVPNEGEPARFGFDALGNHVFLEADVAWESDYHEYFTIHAAKIELPVPGFEEAARILKNRLVFDGTSGPDGTFITTPTTCFGPAKPGTPFAHVYSTFLRADGYEAEFLDPNFPNGSPFVESKIPYSPGPPHEVETSPKNCEDIPFEPSIATEPNTAQTDSPSGATVTAALPEVKNPLKEEESKSTSQVRSARVTLPLGMGINPSAANGLEACTDAQFAKGTRNFTNACPAASQVGTVEVDTPPLEDGSLSGPVYVGQQLSRDPTSGDEYRIFVEPKSASYDIAARLLGKVSADPQTGQLTTTFDDSQLGSVPIAGLPQVPFKSFRLTFRSGSRAPLTSPPTCGPNTTSTSQTPWSSAVGIVPPGGEEGPSTDPPATDTQDFALTSLPGGGDCPKTMAARPFAPSFKAAAAKPQAGAYSPYELEIGRNDGNQELKGIDLVLPPGNTAKLAGVRYCPEATLAAAAANSGAAEAAKSSCPDSSFVGSAVTRSGSGSEPIQIAGKVFLAGPYNGAPLSLAVVTPATAGPFDLGSVVVRVALFVDPRTAQVHAVSDPIPHVFGGALLDLRRVAVRTDRPNFSLNPTSCTPGPLNGVLRGGGANPLSPAAFSAFPVSTSQTMSACQKLGFKPKLFMRTFGATKRAKNPKFRAVLRARDGDANISRATVTLPRAFFLDQASLSKICTRVQYAANQCPKNSIYGYARAVTPLLDGPLKGPVYLRSSDNPLPDLVASLKGQVDIEVSGRIDQNKGRIRNTFDVVPDVPVSKFTITVRGGKKGLLVNSRNLCLAKGGKAPRIRAIAKFKAHNGKKANLRPRLRTPCGKNAKRR